MKDREYINVIDAMTKTSQNNAKLSAENKKLRKALAFYADLESWQERDSIIYPIALDDEGKIAREVLGEIDK